MIKFTPRHLSQAMTWISNVICRGLLIFYIQWTKVRGDCSLCWYFLNCLPSLLKISFHNYNVKSFFYEGANLFFCGYKTTLSFHQKVLWNWYHQNGQVSDWQHICYVLMIHVFFQHTDRSYGDPLISLSAIYTVTKLF